MIKKYKSFTSMQKKYNHQILKNLFTTRIFKPNKMIIILNKTFWKFCKFVYLIAHFKKLKMNFGLE